jgi:ribosomal protein RSM22 (predicted rRNA methylase)
VNPSLPPDLREAAARLIERTPAKAIAQKSQAMSEHYRGGGHSSQAVRDEADAAAYLAARMPATYAAMALALSRAGEQAPGFAPQSLLDAGAGPGTAAWAAAAQWPSLEHAAMLDTNAPMLAAARALCESASATALRNASMVLGEVTAIDAAQSYDLVLSGYAMAEIPGPSLAQTLGALWHACKGVLVIVEPGTPKGFSRILQCRAHLLNAGARMVAPCPGDYPCPSDWCHFSVRLPRSRAHMRAKSASVPFEDERFSYLAVAREAVAVTLPQARIVAEPRATKPGIHLRLCGNGEIREHFAAKRNKPDYKQAATKKWGDPFML